MKLLKKMNHSHAFIHDSVPRDERATNARNRDERARETTVTMSGALIAGVGAVALAFQRKKAENRLERATVARETTIGALHRDRVDAECELALAHADLEETSRALEEAVREREAAEAKVEALEGEKTEGEARAKAEKEQTTKLRFSLTVANGRVDKMRKEIETLKAKARADAKLGEENTRLREHKEDAQKTIESSRKNIQELTEQNGELKRKHRRMEHQLEDLKAMEAKVEAARTSNVELTESLEEKNQELSAATHALQDAEINLRQAESHNVQLGIEVEELREQVVQLRAQEIELQLELKSMLETLTMVTHRDEEGEGEGKGFASPVQLERVIEKFDTPLSERIHGDDGDDMSEVQSRMAILLSRVEECKTPVGISKALAELDDLQSKLRDLQSVEGDSDDIIPQDASSPDAWPISPPSPVTTSKNLADDVNIGEVTPPRSLTFDDDEKSEKSEATTPERAHSDMCEKCGIVPKAEGLERCEECHAKKQAKLASASPLQRGLNSFKKVLSPGKSNGGKKKKGKKK